MDRQIDMTENITLPAFAGGNKFASVKNLHFRYICICQI